MNERIVKNKNCIYIRNCSIALILGDLLYFYFPFPPIVWRVSFLMLSLIAFFSRDNHPTLFEKSAFAFMGLNLFYFLVSAIWIKPTTTNLGNTFFCMSSFLIFPYLGRKAVLDIKFTTITTILLVLACIAYYYHAQELAAQRYTNFDEDSFTNNASAVFLYLLPALFFIRRGWMRFVLLTICVFFIISSVKRGNILASIIPIILLVWYSFKDSKGSIWKTLLVVGSLVVISYFAREWILSNDYFLRRLEDTREGYSSNRDLIYAAAWDLWYYSGSFVKIVFGYGYDGTIQNLFNHYRAHQDWLELLVDYGLVGVCFYAVLFLSYLKIYSRERHYLSRLVLFSSVIIWFMKSCYSMGFTDEYLALLAIPVGIAISPLSKREFA